MKLKTSRKNKNKPTKTFLKKRNLKLKQSDTFHTHTHTHTNYVHMCTHALTHTTKQHHSLDKSTKQCAAKGEGCHGYTTEACYAWECVWEGGLYPCLSQDGGECHLHHPALTPRLDDVLQVVAHVAGGVLLPRGWVFWPRLLPAEWSPFPWGQAALVCVWQKRKRSLFWSTFDWKENNHRSGLCLTEKRTITALVRVWQKRKWSLLWFVPDRKQNDHRSGLCLTEKRTITALVRIWQKRKWSPLWSASDRKENNHRSGLHLTEKKTITALVCI